MLTQVTLGHGSGRMTERDADRLKGIWPGEENPLLLLVGVRGSVDLTLTRIVEGLSPEV